LRAVDHVDLHGHQLAFRREGQGEAVLLVHGIAGTSETWDAVLPELAEGFDVIAPDLPGHGRSGRTASDYSVGAMAATLRDLLVHLGVERATVVGHSLGGGVAMQFAYLFPERCERLVLVSAGGLGKTVNPLLRAAALPISEPFTAGIGLGARAAGAVLGPLGRLAGLRPGPKAQEVSRSMRSLGDGPTRAAFHATLRAVVGPDGQRVWAGDRLYLAEAMPTLILWGDRDTIVPVGHARRAHAAMPGSRLVVLEGARHFPPLEQPHRVVEELRRFLEETEPAQHDPERLAALIRGGSA
jgi:pimeloyl-ACP methyl ester carboxylesterase